MNRIKQRQVIAIHGSPRSGTSWLGQIFNSSESVAYRYQPMFSYAFKDRLNAGSSEKEIDNFFQDLLDSRDDFLLQRGEASLSGYDLNFKKRTVSHLVYKEVRYHHLIENLLSKCERFRLVALIRDPCSVMLSWLNAPREFDASWDFAKEWRYAPTKNCGRDENWYGFERWKELVLLFIRLKELYPSRVKITRYESLLSSPVESLRELFEFSGLEMTNQTTSFLERSTGHNDGNPYGVFRDRQDEVSDPYSVLPNAIVQSIKSELCGTALERYIKG